jgi:hypothetical protein
MKQDLEKASAVDGSFKNSLANNVLVPIHNEQPKLLAQVSDLERLGGTCHVSSKRDAQVRNSSFTIHANELRGAPRPLAQE